MPQYHDHIRGIIFDLDGTLYASEIFAAAIQEAAAKYVAGIKGISAEDSARIITETYGQLSRVAGVTPALSAVCIHLGGNIHDLHAFFERNLNPEAILTRDERVVSLLFTLGQHFLLYLYTNNNRPLTSRILDHLGLKDLFRKIYTIDDSWIAKPDTGILSRILTEAGLLPGQTLFVGDRYDIDLRLPESLGCPVYLSQNIEQLLQLEEFLLPVVMS